MVESKKNTLKGEIEMMGNLNLTCMEAGILVSDKPVEHVLEVHGNKSQMNVR